MLGLTSAEQSPRAANYVVQATCLPPRASCWLRGGMLGKEKQLCKNVHAHPSMRYAQHVRRKMASKQKQKTQMALAKELESFPYFTETRKSNKLQGVKDTDDNVTTI